MISHHPQQECEYHCFFFTLSFALLCTVTVDTSTTAFIFIFVDVRMRFHVSCLIFDLSDRVFHFNVQHILMARYRGIGFSTMVFDGRTHRAPAPSSPQQPRTISLFDGFVESLAWARGNADCSGGGGGGRDNDGGGGELNPESTTDSCERAVAASALQRSILELGADYLRDPDGARQGGRLVVLGVGSLVRGAFA